MIPPGTSSAPIHTGSHPTVLWTPPIRSPHFSRLQGIPRLQAREKIYNTMYTAAVPFSLSFFFPEISTHASVQGSAGPDACRGAANRFSLHDIGCRLAAPTLTVRYRTVSSSFSRSIHRMAADVEAFALRHSRFHWPVRYGTVQYSTRAGQLFLCTHTLCSAAVARSELLLKVSWKPCGAHRAAAEHYSTVLYCTVGEAGFREPMLDSLIVHAPGLPKRPEPGRSRTRSGACRSDIRNVSCAGEKLPRDKILFGKAWNLDVTACTGSTLLTDRAPRGKILLRRHEAGCWYCTVSVLYLYCSCTVAVL